MKNITLSPILTLNFLCPRWLLSIKFMIFCYSTSSVIRHFRPLDFFVSGVSTKLYPCCHYAAILMNSHSIVPFSLTLTLLELQSEHAKLTLGLRIFCLHLFYSFFFYQAIQQVTTIAVSAKGKEHFSISSEPIFILLQ